MSEPLACALHGMDQAGVRPGDAVLILGGGTIGLLMVQLAKLRGAAYIAVSEPVAGRREMALAMGADETFDPARQNAAEQLRLRCGGADRVLECAGLPQTARQAVEAAGFGATIVLFGVPAPDAELALPLFTVYQKELSVKGSFINPDTQQRAVELLNSGRVQVERLITHVYPLAEVARAIQKQTEPDSIKVMVHPQE